MGQKRSEQHSFMKVEPEDNLAKVEQMAQDMRQIKEAGVERGEMHQVQSSEDLFPCPEHHTEGDMNRNPRGRCRKRRRTERNLGGR